MSRVIILSDIHGNLSALSAVYEDFQRKYDFEGVMLLGDIINYGMRPNEVIAFLQNANLPVIVNIFGNHEKALFDGDTSHFSTDRGKQLLNFTRQTLSDDSKRYLSANLNHNGMEQISIGNRRIFAVHGNIDDPFWGKLNASTIADDRYTEFDYVISGHSHVPHLIEHFSPADRPDYRNKRRTIFINPGSVGQPRNHNPKAQYAYIDFDNEIFHLNAVSYDISAEQSLYHDTVDHFYSTRLTNGI